MAKHTPQEIYQALLHAGFDTTSASIMTAIAGAEDSGSGYDDTALGDVSLQDNLWGPSVGVFQIRTLKGATGSGQVRDISWLTSVEPLARQARAAYQLSDAGRNFTPWSTFNSGAYRQYLSGLAGLPGSSNNPTNPTQDNTGGKVSGWKALVLESCFAILGLGLTVAGLKTFGKGK